MRTTYTIIYETEELHESAVRKIKVCCENCAHFVERGPCFGDCMLRRYTNGSPDTERVRDECFTTVINYSCDMWERCRPDEEDPAYTYDTGDAA